LTCGARSQPTPRLTSPRSSPAASGNSRTPAPDDQPATQSPRARGLPPADHMEPFANHLSASIRRHGIICAYSAAYSNSCRTARPIDVDMASMYSTQDQYQAGLQLIDAWYVQWAYTQHGNTVGEDTPGDYAPMVIVGPTLAVLDRFAPWLARDLRADARTYPDDDASRFRHYPVEKAVDLGDIVLDANRHTETTVHNHRLVIALPPGLDGKWLPPEQAKELPGFVLDSTAHNLVLASVLQWNYEAVMTRRSGSAHGCRIDYFSSPPARSVVTMS